MTGTVLGVGISGILAILFGKWTHISGYNVADIEQLTYVGQTTNIKIGELLYAGILISALGAVMDVAMSIASTINEIHFSQSTAFCKGIIFFGDTGWKRYDGDNVKYTDFSFYRYVD